jgi:hypothetical protein
MLTQKHILPAFLPFSLCWGSSVANSEPDPWALLTDSLKPASALIHHPDTPRDPVTIADGYRALPRLLRMAWEYGYEYADPAYPVLFKATENYLSDGWKTSDAQYHSAIIDGSRNYRISGLRGGAPLLEITANEGFDGMHKESKMVNSVTEETLQINGDGTFSLAIGPDRQSGNWLATTPDTNFILVRQYSHDWQKTEAATLRIEPLDSPGYPVVDRAPTVAEIEAGYQRTAQYLVEYITQYHARAVGLLKHFRNQVRIFPHNDPQGSTMPAGHHFALAMFDLNDGESLLLEFVPEEAPYWGIQLGNFWGDTLAYGQSGSHLNNKTVQLEPDGSVRVVVGNNPPASGNWLDTRGRKVGNLLYRQARKLERMPSFTTTVVRLDRQLNE